LNLNLTRLLGENRTSEVETLHAVLASVDFSLTLALLSSLYHAPGTRGHPYHSPLTLLKIELVKRFVEVEAYAEVYRRLQSSEEWRRVCGIGSVDEIPHPSTWSRFRKRVGAARLQLILGDLLRQLSSTGICKASIIAADATFIEAYSKRDPKNNTVGYSDPEARLRVEGRNVTLGYGVHLAVDVVKGLVVGFVVAPANRNEKRVLPHLLMRLIMAGFRVKTLIADTQYSSRVIRRLCSLWNIAAIIPYPKNHFKHVKGLLRVDKLFRAHGPKRQVQLYHKRSANERGNAWLKGFYGLDQLRTRGLENATIHVTLCVMVSYIIAIAALKHNRPDLIRSPTLPHQIYMQKLILQ
jgi:transposase